MKQAKSKWAHTQPTTLTRSEQLGNDGRLEADNRGLTNVKELHEARPSTPTHYGQDRDDDSCGA